MITRSLTLVAILAALALLLVATAQAAPNVLIVFTDDHGWADLGANGVNADVVTPNIDQLARDGVHAIRGYATAPRCAPSRAAMVTGAYQQRFSFEDNEDILPPDTVTLGDRLQSAGYVTGFVGKWHLGVEVLADQGYSPIQDYWPGAYGFDEWCWGIYDAMSEVRNTYRCNVLPDGTLVNANDMLLTRADYRTREQTQFALDFLTRRAASPSTPWMLYLAYYSPHAPNEAVEPWYSATDTGLTDLRRRAISEIAEIDDGVRQLREQIEAMGQTDNTLIFVIGDNGAQLAEVNANGSLNAPLIGSKNMLVDGGTRVPYVAAWPGQWRPGQVVGAPISTLDVAATAVAAAGITDTSGLDGVDLTPYFGACLPGAAYPWAACARQPRETLYFRFNDQAAAIHWPWKLIQIGADDATHYTMLFDLSLPSGEQYGVDLTAALPRVSAALKARLESWADALPVPGLLPSPNGVYPALYQDYGVLAP